MNYFLEGLKLIRQPGLRAYVIIPILINVVVFISLFVFGYGALDVWITDTVNDLPEWLSFLSWIMWVLIVLTAAAFLFYGFTMIANLIASPFNAILAIKVEEKVSGQKAPSENMTELMMILPRTVAREIGKLMYYLPRLLVIILVTFIPVVNIISPALWFGFGVWMMSVQYTDYAADNNKVSFKDLRERLARDKFNSIGFGFVVYLMMVIPLLNLIVIPAAVAGGTAFWVDRLGSMNGPVAQ